MPLDYTVIFSSTQAFGDNPNAQTKDFTFDCPNLMAGETAFLLFQSQAVMSPQNVFQINGVDVWGGLPANMPSLWFFNVVLVESRHQLRPTGNLLHIAAGAWFGKLNDFLLDNMVIGYKALATPDRPPFPPRPI